MSGYCPSHRYRSPLRGPKAQPSPYWTVSRPGDILAEPIVARDGTIYVGSSNASLYALAADGGARWTFTVPYDAGPDAAPIGISGAVAIGADSNVRVSARTPASTLYSLRPSDGQIVGQRAVSDSESPLVIGPDGTIYLIGVGEDLRWLFPNGTDNVTYPAGGSDYTVPAIGEDNSLYVAAADGEMARLSPDGSTLWSTTYDASANALAYMALAPDGTLRAAIAAVYAASLDGGPAWTASPPFGPIQGMAVGDDGRTVIAEQNGPLVGVTAGGDAGIVADGVFSGCGQPVIDADGWTYAGCNGSIVAYDAALHQRWSVSYQGTLNGAPVLGEGETIYFTVDAYTASPLVSAVYALR
jgi:hypothetical protein